jgi:hypothetical protein
VVLPLAFNMDPSKLDVQVEWVDQATGIAHGWDSAPKTRFSITNANEHVVNTVRVTVRYDWAPALPFVSLTRLTSTSEFPMGS